MHTTQPVQRLGSQNKFGRSKREFSVADAGKLQKTGTENLSELVYIGPNRPL